VPECVYEGRSDQSSTVIFKTAGVEFLLYIYTVSQKNVLSHFCNNFINCSPILKILALLDTVINYLQNKYNTSRQG